MPNFTAAIELTAGQRAELSILSDQEINEEKNQSILRERERALEQIKRLYAVVMGFAVLASIGNAYQCARRIPALINDPVPLYWVLGAQVFSLLSLIALFYLGAERMLDRKYLTTRAYTPGRFSLLFDLLSIGAPALLFVYAANLFPSVAVTAEEVAKILKPDLDIAFPDLRISILKNFERFMWCLLLIYAMDLASIVGHWFSLPSQEHDAHLRKAYQWWCLFNIVSGLLVYVMADNFNLWRGGFRLTAAIAMSWITLAIIALHAGRFLVDYFKNFRFYFPPEATTSPPVVQPQSS